MSHEHEHHEHCGHDHHAPGHEHGEHQHAAKAFSHNEEVAMHADDRIAARNIVLLMVSIFVMGLAGYIAVGYWVAHS